MKAIGSKHYESQSATVKSWTVSKIFKMLVKGSNKSGFIFSCFLNIRKLKKNLERAQIDSQSTTFFVFSFQVYFFYYSLNYYIILVYHIMRRSFKYKNIKIIGLTIQK